MSKKIHIPEYGIRDHLIHHHGYDKKHTEKSNLVDLAKAHIRAHEDESARNLDHFHKQVSE